MSERSILLELDGSAQARYAAEVAWSMAKAADTSVDAQHVVDSLAAWDFLAFDLAGFIGSGPYFEAHDAMRASLSNVGQNLIDVYKQIAHKNGIAGETFLDEGSNIREICSRAKDYEIVVMGHQSTGMGSPNEDKRKLPRRSVTETLTHYISRPLLLVQDRSAIWSHARLLLGSEAVPAQVLQNCMSFINWMAMEPTVRYIYQADNNTKADTTAASGLRPTTDITKAVPELKGQKIEVRSVSDVNEYLVHDAEEAADTLLVVPVIESQGKRKTAFGASPDVMVRYLNHPAVLFWMEFADSELPAAQPSKSVSSAV